MELKELIEKLKAMVGELRQRGNAALKDLPPLETLEAGQEIVSALRCFRYSVDEVASIADHLNHAIPAVDTYESAVRAETESKLLAEEKHVTKTDHEAQIQAAKEAGKTEAETAFQAREQMRATVAERRQKATEKLGAKASAALPEETLAGDQHEAAVTAMASRIESMKANGISEEKTPDVFAEMLAIALDEAGNATFQARMKSYESFFKAHSGGKAPDFKASAPPVQQPSGDNGGSGLKCYF